jgi:WASH complex subunit strumpellin
VCTTKRTQFIEDIREGVFIQHTMESMLFDPTGKQLMAEAVYLYGVMLTLMDCKIDGAVRERILVAYYRVKVRTRDATFETKVLQAGLADIL